MDKYKSLEYIANGLYAANKLNQAVSKNVRSDSGSPIKAIDLHTLNEFINIISQYSPESHGRALREIADKSREYSDAYRNIKQHIYSARSRGMDKDFIMDTLKVVRPVMNARQMTIIDKIIKIDEILKS